MTQAVGGADVECLFPENMDQICNKILVVFIGKNLTIRYVSRYKGNNTIY